MQQYRFNNLYDVIEYNAQLATKKTIIYEDGLKISNIMLKDYVDKVSGFLIDSGIKPGDKVALVMSNSWQYIVNIFAISKIGAIVVPINNFFKMDEISYVLNDARAKILFSSEKFSVETKGLLSKTEINKIVWVNGCALENENNIDYSKIMNAVYPVNKPFDLKLDDTAFILYTSGTTGKPKGAELSFKNIFSNCEGGKKLMGVKDGQIRMLSYLPMFHAFTLTATVILPVYTNSGVVVIRSISNRSDFKNLLKQLLLHRCRYFAGVPDIYSAMSKATLPWYFHWFHNVKGFISGAAPLSDEVSKRFSTSFKRGKLLQGYGITECSPIVSCNSPAENKVGSVGKPLLDYQVKICDDNMKDLEIGSIGEICVKGDCVMKGYYNRPEDTKEAIIDGWFRTGDIGRLDKEGFIYIVDRKKDLIIHKGMNIYPREIEEVLYTYDKINACAVVGIRDDDGNEVPVVYIELREDQTCTETEIKDFLKPHLASFKQPRRVYFMAELPRNATKKILKRELRELHKTIGERN
ncbi:MAG: long-chain-fatty-acid--CoA ligase [Proteobacteria bacterium]|jgi:long-chain acyl-CoA synthetase|nr:long-chain-fatty-acid--CoA ligase [Pseudomonadota bacterium]